MHVVDGVLAITSTNEVNITEGLEVAHVGVSQVNKLEFWDLWDLRFDSVTGNFLDVDQVLERGSGAGGG